MPVPTHAIDVMTWHWWHWWIWWNLYFFSLLSVIFSVQNIKAVQI